MFTLASDKAKVEFVPIYVNDAETPFQVIFALKCSQFTIQRFFISLLTILVPAGNLFNEQKWEK